MGNITRIGTIDYSDLTYSSNDDDIAKFSLVRGDVIFNRTNSKEWVGKTAVYDEKMPAIFAGYLVRFHPIIASSEYINYAMCSDYERSWCIAVKTDGVNQSNINTQKLKRFLIPMPPLAEQCRIVSSIQQSLMYVSEIERSQQHLEELFKQVRSKVLDLAIRGKLVEQDPADEPASVLLERIRQEKLRMVAEGKLKNKDIANDSVIFRGEDNSYYERLSDGAIKPISEERLWNLPDVWQWSRLGAHVTTSGGKTPSKEKAEYWENGNVAWVTSKDMKSEELVDSKMHITELAASKMNMVPKDSVLMVVRSGILRRLLPVAINRMNTAINQDLKALIANEALKPEFLYVVISAMDQKIRAKYHKDGTTVDSIDIDRFINMPIPIPPISEQDRIANVIRSLLEELRRITR